MNPSTTLKGTVINAGMSDSAGDAPPPPRRHNVAPHLPERVRLFLELNAQHQRDGKQGGAEHPNEPRRMCHENRLRRMPQKLSIFVQEIHIKHEHPCTTTRERS